MEKENKIREAMEEGRKYSIKLGGMDFDHKPIPVIQKELLKAVIEVIEEMLMSSEKRVSKLQCGQGGYEYGLEDVKTKLEQAINKDSQRDMEKEKMETSATKAEVTTDEEGRVKSSDGMGVKEIAHFLDLAEMMGKELARRLDPKPKVLIADKGGIKKVMDRISGREIVIILPDPTPFRLRTIEEIEKENEKERGKRPLKVVIEEIEKMIYRREDGSLDKNEWIPPEKLVALKTKLQQPFNKD